MFGCSLACSADLLDQQFPAQPINVTAHFAFLFTIFLNLQNTVNNSIVIVLFSGMVFLSV